MAHSGPVYLPPNGSTNKYVKLYVDWTAATENENIISGLSGEALATSMGKISKWYTDFTKLVFTDLTIASSGSGNAITSLSYDNLTGKITYTMDSFATVTSAMRMLNTDPTTSTKYNVLFASPNSSSNNGYFRVNDDFTVLIKKGLANSSGWSALVLGNSTAAGTDGAKYGVVRIYNDGSSYLQFSGIRSDSLVLRASSESITTLNFSPYSTNNYDLGTSTYKWRNVYAGTFNGYTIEKSVPSDALFTDTVYTHPTYTAKTTEALYTIKVDTLGHVSTANAATSDTITNLVSKAGVSTLINKLATGSSTPRDADYYISQYANGGTTTTTYHRRPMSALWTYVKGKADSVYSALGHTHNYAGSSSAGGAATSANKLNTDAGGVVKPVYFSNGVPVACNAPTSGAWWNTVSHVTSGGVSEIGRYIDFHCTSESTNSYDVRLDAGASNKSLIVQCANTTSGPWLTVQGVLPKLKFIQTTSGYEYNKDSCGITAYPGSYDAGLNLIMQSGGNTIIGSGEIASTFMTSLNDGDRSDINKYPYYWRDNSERTYLAADENAYIWTGGASWDSTKKYFLNLHCFIFSNSGNFALPVGGTIYYRYGTRDENGMVGSFVQSGLVSAATTTARTWTLPDATGTIALTSNIPATYAGSTTAGGAATTVTITNTENTSEVSKAIPFHDDSTGGPYSLLTNNGLGYRTLNGTASALGISRIVIGNATASGTAGNKYGVVRIYSRQKFYADIQTASTYGANRTFTLPNKGGTVAVTGAGTWQDVSSVTDSSEINTYDIKYRKGDASAVEIRGSIKFQTLQASYSLTTLPSGYRPDIDRVFPIMDPDTGGYKGRLRITSAGVTTLQFTAPNVLSTSVTYYFSGMFTV